MRNDPIIEFAQRRFGTDTGLPTETGARAPLPGWLAGPASEATIPGEGDDPIRVEDYVPGPEEPEPTADGTTAEALAFYLPFHFYPAAWGIYLWAAGVWALARRLALPREVPDLTALGCAYCLLLEHERLHFCAEYAASRIEVVTAKACYSAYFSNGEAGLHEEALANARALGILRRRVPSRLTQVAAAWMATQGVGYRDFNEWLPPRFTDGERRASAFMTIKAGKINLVECVSSRLNGAPAYACHPAEFVFLGTAGRSVPVYIVLDRSVPWVRVAKPFPKEYGLQVFVHFNDHKPPHIHIDCPPGTPRTRYQWPELTPLRGDRPLGAAEKRRLCQYLKTHGRDIGRKVTGISWK